MKYILTGKQMREADNNTIEKIGIPSMVLMERAALGVVEAFEKGSFKKDEVLIVCGSGNNGGDGYAIARLLHLKGYKVSVYFVGKEESRSHDNSSQRNICEYYKIPCVNTIDQENYDVVIDAIFGTGLSRNIEGIYRDVIETLNNMKAYKISVDIPSGIHDSTGAIMGIAFKADLTVAIAYMKRGIVLQPGNAYSGHIEIADIGIYDDAIPNDESWMFTYEKKDLGTLVPKRKSNSHKGSYGKVGLIVGSKGMSGAAYLCAKAAYMTGAGLVQIYTHEDNRTIMQNLVPEAIVTTYETFDSEQLDRLIAWSDVIGIGCGLGQSEVSKQILHYIMNQDLAKVLIDADGLNILSENMSLLDNVKSKIVLTPHMKEMSRLLGCDVKELQNNRIELLQEFTKKYPVVCVLKDARTLVGKGKEKLYINMTGNSSMAKGGTGDVLAGIISGLLAQSEDEFDMASLGVYLHGLSGDLARDYKGSFSVMASDLIYGLVDILKQI